MAVVVKNKRSNVVGKVPTTLDLEVGQIAINTADKTVYIKDDAGNIVELYTQKADLSSPSLIGTPTAPTQTPLDNSTKIATTAFVQGHVSDLSVLIAALDARLTLIGG